MAGELAEVCGQEMDQQDCTSFCHSSLRNKYRANLDTSCQTPPRNWQSLLSVGSEAEPWNQMVAISEKCLNSSPFFLKQAVLHGKSFHRLERVRS